MYIPVADTTINVNLRPEVILSEEQEQLVETYWKGLLKTKPFTNGRGYALQSYSIDSEAVTLNIIPTDYKHTVYAVNVKPSFYCPVRMAVSAVIMNEKKVFLAQRGNNVGTYANTLNHWGGLVDFDEQMHAEKFVQYLETEMIREIREEVVVDEIKGIHLHGIHVEESTTETDVVYVVEANVKGVVEDENERVIDVERSDFESFYKKNYDTFSPISRKILPKVFPQELG